MLSIIDAAGTSADAATQAIGDAIGEALASPIGGITCGVNMPKLSSKRIDRGKLEFRFTKDGLYIAGDKRGLLKLVSLLQWVARGQNSYHSHLSLEWKKWLKAGSLVIDFEYIRKRLLRRATAPQADVTIMISDDVENHLPK